MPSYVGTITIEFNANWVGNHIVYFTLTGGVTYYTSPITVNCTALGPCSVTLDDIEYDKPSCTPLVIEGVIFAECDIEEENPLGYTFTKTLDGDCYTTLAKCINPEGCEAFDTTLLCTKCDYGMNNTIVDTYSSIPSPPGFDGNNYVPYNSEYRFCLLDPDEFSQGLTPNDWDIKVYPNNSDPEACCYECEVVRFQFADDEFASGQTRTWPNIFPQIVYTACDELCYRASVTRVFPTLGPINPISLCLRKGSWTVIGNEKPYVAVVTGTCSI
jgi:hypothetical protein